MGNYAIVNIVDDLKRINGVGDASVLTSNDYSMRIWIKPDIMSKLGLTTADVMSAVSEQNAQRAAGKVGQFPSPTGVERTYSIVAPGRLKTVEEFESIILSYAVVKKGFDKLVLFTKEHKIPFEIDKFFSEGSSWKVSVF